MACPHSSRLTPDRCSQCIGIAVPRVNVAVGGQPPQRALTRSQVRDAASRARGTQVSIDRGKARRAGG